MKILYACNDLDYFNAHRGFLAQAMIAKGWQVILSTGGVEKSKSQQTKDSPRILSVSLDRHRLNFKSDLKLIGSYFNQIRTEKPDVVHAITIKPILFMGIALLLNKLFLGKAPKLVLTYPGLGRVFEPDDSYKARLRKFLVATSLKVSNQVLKPHSTFENHSSMEELVRMKIVTPANSSVVMGAGIDRGIFYTDRRKGSLTVLFASRLLKAKGLGEYIEAAKNLKVEFSKVRFQVAGKEEADNPDAFSMKELVAANDAGIIEYIGAIEPEKMPETLRQADIHVAPSKLQEGLPRVVLEAASCGCCVIASDHEMLQRFVIENETGWLMEKVSSKGIENKLRLALSDAEKTRAMGKLIASKMSELPIFEDNLINHFEELYQS